MNAKIIKCENWEDFLMKVKMERPKELSHMVSVPLFRGQSNSEYLLESTLERVMKARGRDAFFKLVEYHRTLLRLRGYFETLKQRSWDIPERLPPMDYERTEVPITSSSVLEFMIYLRHIGFPSPLLDWTYSHYIASFFAFREMPFLKNRPDHVAVFMFVKDVGKGRSGIYMGTNWKNNRNIIVVESDLRTHPRHYLQQAVYTYCVVCEKIGDISTFYYAPYLSFNPQDDDGGILQDKLLKFLIPSKEYDAVLKELNRMNINSYTLFNSEESLAEKLTYEIFGNL